MRRLVALAVTLLLGGPLSPRAVAQSATPPAEPSAQQRDKEKKKEKEEKKRQKVPPGEPKPPKPKPKPKPKPESNSPDSLGGHAGR